MGKPDRTFDWAMAEKVCSSLLVITKGENGLLGILFLVLISSNTAFLMTKLVKVMNFAHLKHQ